ncbi:MAG TPA: hypothetical protein VEC06_00135 [Paucimonas sp.]|nr:hypothetical protein [Paucimonas sp.]
MESLKRMRVNCAFSIFATKDAAFSLFNMSANERRGILRRNILFAPYVLSSLVKHEVMTCAPHHARSKEDAQTPSVWQV